ncbi:MAG: molybdopterin molybdotransferase MoeA [Bacteroidota bacterium]|nr:molybdopterin molybdotransferase MoeA [Bacteroidota bacterium]
MIDYHEAQKLIEEQTKPLNAIKLPLMETLGYTLAKNIIAKYPIPTFNSSAVDGFAVNVNGLKLFSHKNQVSLKVQAVIQAGDTRKHSLKNNHTFKIFTGALVPRNINTVVMKEDVEEIGGNVIFKTLPEVGTNIRKCGGEFSKGALVLSSGVIITPPVLGLLASLGNASVNVYRKPKVSIIVTGNELKKFSEQIKPGEIRDSNLPSLLAALQLLNIQPEYAMSVKDQKREIQKAIQKALKISDVVITAGGVSVGDYDFVKDVCSSLGIKTVFWRAAIKPGKPLLFGTKGKKLIFGVPGNPVAALLSFYLFIKPTLLRMMGQTEKQNFIQTAVLESDLRKRAGRLEFVRGIFIKKPDGKLVVNPTKGQDSHMLGGFANANCLIHFPKDENVIMKGTSVKIELLKWDINQRAMSEEHRATNKKQ